jgi:Glycosyltransferase family 87
MWVQSLVLALLIVFWVGYLRQSPTLASYCMRTDFLGIYVGARCVAIGQGVDLYNLDRQREVMDAAIAPNRRGSLMTFVYPAYVAVILAPLGRLGLTSAYLLWLGVNVAAAGWTIQQLCRMFAGSLGTRSVILACMAWLPLQLTLFQGQLSLLPTLGVVKAMGALEEGSNWRAGAWLSLGLMKPQLLLFPLLAFLVWGCWRGLVVVAGASLAVMTVSIVALGFWIPEYWRFLGEYTQRGPALALYPKAMQNWRGLVTSVLGIDGGWSVLCLIAGLSAVSVMLAVVLIRDCSPIALPHKRTSVWEPRYAVVVLLGLLSSPHSYMHDWVMALPAGMALGRFGRELGQLWWSKCLLWMLAFAPVVFLVTDFTRKWFLEPTVPVYASVLIMVACLGFRSEEKRRVNCSAAIQERVV